MVVVEVVVVLWAVGMIVGCGDCGCDGWLVVIVFCRLWWAVVSCGVVGLALVGGCGGYGTGLVWCVVVVVVLVGFGGW